MMTNMHRRFGRHLHGVASRYVEPAGDPPAPLSENVIAMVVVALVALVAAVAVLMLR